jgi:hypothetical protein
MVEGLVLFAAEWTQAVSFVTREVRSLEKWST